MIDSPVLIGRRQRPRGSAPIVTQEMTMTSSLVRDHPVTALASTPSIPAALPPTPAHLILIPGAASRRLNARERDVLALVAEGYSTREVAKRLCYSERTIKNILQDVTTRLALRNRTQAVAVAIRQGWI
jgi:DNA-binding NarL/FixJ family response regulator